MTLSLVRKGDLIQVPATGSVGWVHKLATERGIMIRDGERVVFLPASMVPAAVRMLAVKP